MYTHKIIHIGTGVTCERFESAEAAQKWLDNYQVSQSYKARWYRIVCN